MKKISLLLLCMHSTVTITATPPSPTNLIRAISSLAESAVIEKEIRKAKKNGTLNAHDESGETALTLSVQQNNVGLARLLLNAGANPNYPGIEREPLHEAVFNNFSEMARLLLQNGADANAQTPTLFKYTPLILCNCGAIALMLLNHKANPALKSRGDNALEWAIERGAHDIADAILSVYPALRARPR